MLIKTAQSDHFILIEKRVYFYRELFLMINKEKTVTMKIFSIVF